MSTVRLSQALVDRNLPKQKEFPSLWHDNPLFKYICPEI